ncbi:MAG: V-type ATPase 116kDa subunit family protein, partial [Eubacteriales bacterium]|nr:V-type ATPase 116kDa subunit family protein [Eubacteriales bacterium]
MKKIQVIGMDRDRDRLIRDLMNLGAVEISSKKPEENEGAANLLTDSDMEQIQKLDQEISDTELALETLDKYSPEKRPLFFTRSEMGRQSFEAVLTESDTIRRQRGEILELHEKLHQMNEERNRASSEIMSLEPWEAYGAPLEQKETESCMISLGILPQNPQDDLRAKLEEAGDTWMLETVRQDKNYLYLLFVCMKQDADVYQNLLKQAGWTEAPFRDLKGTVAECEADARERIADIEEKIRGVEADITGRFNQKKTIECYHDGLLIERDRIAVKGNLLHTERTFLFEGWVPVPAVKKVEKCLDASGCYYQLSDPSEEDTVPVLTKAGKFVYPFEAITSMYSLPDYHGIDPTSFFAIFYALFFGMMLSDAGYGVIITVATALILKKYKLEGTTYQMIKMFFYCGIATIFWGALFGSWFGNFVQVFSGTFLGKEVSIRPIWF